MKKELSVFDKEKGAATLEIIIALAFIAIINVAVLGEVNSSQLNELKAEQLNQAAAIAHEGIEVIKGIRDADWNALDTTKHGLQQVSATWQLIDAPDIVDNFFRREVQITDIDTNHKEVAVTVSALNAVSTITVTLTTRFANWVPTQEDWIVLFAEGAFDFTAANSGSNNHNVQTLTAVDNYLYVGNANSAGKELIIFDITQSPTLTMVGSLDLDGTPKKIVVSGNYAYVASTSNTEELQIVDVSNRSNPVIVATFNLTNANSGHDNNDALAVDVSGSNLVLGRLNSGGLGGGEEIFVFDIADPALPNLLGKLQTIGYPNDLRISGVRAYVASTDYAQELKIVNFSNPNFPILENGVNVNSGDDNKDALSVNYASNRLYLGRKGSNDAPELYLFNIADQANPILLSTFDAGAVGNNVRVKHIAFAGATSDAFLVTSGDNAFKVVRNTNDLLSLLSQLSLPGTPNESTYSSLTQKMYVGGHSNPEIHIIAPTLIL